MKNVEFPESPHGLVGAAGPLCPVVLAKNPGRLGHADLLNFVERLIAGSALGAVDSPKIGHQLSAGDLLSVEVRSGNNVPLRIRDLVSTVGRMTVRNRA